MASEVSMSHVMFVSRRPAVPSSARSWRGLTTGAGLLVVATFFLPAMKSCDGSVTIPAREWTASLTAHDSNLDNVVAATFLYLVPYLAALFLMLGAAARLSPSSNRSRHWSRTADRGVTGCLLFTVLMTVSGACDALHQSFHAADVPVAFAVGLSLWLLAARRLKEQGHLARALVTSGFLAAWFVFWSRSADALYGVVLACAGSAGLLVGATGEAVALTGAPVHRAVWSLLSCRPAR